ncbi:MAG: hypothetical protein IJ794_12505 [Lachnospiraceae bacterium]|nr:hypothetical protein [Lachnospiraceae bacterium]
MKNEMMNEKDKTKEISIGSEVVIGIRSGIERGVRKVKEELFWKKDEGIDGILVTVGLCIIALVLCVVMKDSLSTFITTLVSSMTSKATTILNGATSSGTILL